MQWLIKTNKRSNKCKIREDRTMIKPSSSHTQHPKSALQLSNISTLFPSSNFLPSALVPPPSPTFPLFPHAPGVFFHIKRCWILSLHCFLEELRAWEVGSIQPKPNGNLWKTLSCSVDFWREHCGNVRQPLIKMGIMIQKDLFPNVVRFPHGEALNNLKV